MTLIGELKEKVEQAETKEEAKQAIEEAGMILADAELDQVAETHPVFRRKEGRGSHHQGHQRRQ